MITMIREATSNPSKFFCFCFLLLMRITLVYQLGSQRYLLFLLEHKLTSAGRVETCRRCRKARLVSGDCERAMLYLVDRIARTADIAGNRAVGDYGDDLLRSGV